MHPNLERRPLPWFLFAASAFTAIAFFFVPAFVIRPFHHQTPSALSLAMALRQRAPLVTLAAALFSLLFALVLWRAASRSRKIILASVMAVVAFSAVMARLNYFEWMFHPLDAAQFESASASKLDKGEMILAVRYGSDARAYPIREMAYHHVLNDVVAGVPVAVTY
jgi:glucan phosphoethanolaminetransferase (alkaline phosphatase superfamily)